jgi:hypothetical protein
MPITVVAPFEFEDDHHSLTMKLTGGMKAWQRSPDEWSIGPIIYRGEIMMGGLLSRAELQSAISAMGLIPVVLEHRVVMSGVKSVTWRSVDPVRPNSPLAATDIWQTIRGNLMAARLKAFRKNNTDASTQEIIDFKEQNTREENLCGYISDSLRSMDICISAICDYYHEQLTAHLRQGRKVGERSSNMADLPFIANVHSFFVHLGAARDYLAALIAHRCGLPEDVDAMNRLGDKLRWNSLPDDPILSFLVNIGCVSEKENSTKVRLSGWLEDVSNVRNELIHKRPFGSHETEIYGQIKSAGGLEGHFRFFKPIVLTDVANSDTLDYLADVYSRVVKLFGELALASGRDSAIITLTSRDILDFKVEAGKPADKQS